MQWRVSYYHKISHGIQYIQGTFVVPIKTKLESMDLLLYKTVNMVISLVMIFTGYWPKLMLSHVNMYVDNLDFNFLLGLIITPSTYILVLMCPCEIDVYNMSMEVEE